MSYGIRSQSVVPDFDYWLPVQRCWVMEDVKRRVRRGTLEDDIEPVVFAETLGGVVFVRGEGDVAGVRAAFNFDESNVNGGFRVFRMRLSGNEIETSIISLDALDNASFGFLVRGGNPNGNALDFRVGHHRGDLR